MKIQLFFPKFRTIGLLMFLCIALNSSAFNYSVSFIGHGSSTDVTSVLVQNITKGTSATVAAGQLLNLTDGLTTTTNITADKKNDILFTSDPQGNSFISFNVKQAGNTMINAYSLSGQKVAGIKNDLSEGSYRYKLSLPEGVYVVQIVGNGFNYNASLISRSKGTDAAQIQLSGAADKTEQSSASRVSASSVSMDYASGDRIIFKGYSGNMCTIVSDVITANKTIDFNFVPCQDASGNHYATITIGDQVWMAENLKTTKYADGTDIILRASQAEYLADPARHTTPICRYFQDNAATKDIGGLAYKYQTITNKDICPAGWHIPNHFEWRILRDAISLTEADRINSIRKTTDGYWDITGATNVSGFSAIATGGFWDEWPINSGKWAIWLASDLWNNDPGNCWFFYVGKHAVASNPSIVCDELSSDVTAMFGAIRCLKNN